MNSGPDFTVAPSLFGDAPLPSPVIKSSGGRTPRTLLDLMEEGFFMLFLLKNRHAPKDEDGLAREVQRFLSDFERGAAKLDVRTEDVFHAKYAFCAAVDEIVLTSQFRIRDAWERRPLQLALFGEQLAGENFFARLETLRSGGSDSLQALEIFHMCLLLGFKGKYILEGPEKLGYLTARLGDEIAHMKGKRPAFSPHWKLPDQISHTLKRDVPLWVIGSVFTLIALLIFIGMRSWLEHDTDRVLGRYADVVKLAPRVANLTITLP